MASDVNFVHTTCMEFRGWSYMALFDRLFDSEPPVGFRFQTFAEHETLAHLMQRAGLFKSVGEARRNGWNKPVPPGFSTYVVGKGKTNVTIFNTFAALDEPACVYLYCRCGSGKGITRVCPFGGLA